MRPPTEQRPSGWRVRRCVHKQKRRFAEQRVPFFKNLLRLTPDVESVCDLGANVGHNLIAILSIVPSVLATGVELNPFAFRQLSSIPGITAVHSAIQDYAPNGDLTWYSRVEY